MNFLNWFETQTRLFPGAVFVDLTHVRTAGSSRLKRYVLPREDPGSIASLVLTDAHQAAEAMRGVQTFSVGLVEENKTEPVSEHLMRVGDAMGPGASYDSESPSLEGVCKQLMRHTEALMRSHTLGAQQTHNTLSQENERLRGRLDALEGKHFETIALQEELLSQRHLRDIEAMRAVAGEKRKETLLRTVATLAPAMVPTMANKLLGGAGQPEAAPRPVDPAIGAFAESLTDEQRMALSRLLRPEQIAALGMLFQRHGSNGPKRNPGNSGTPSNVN
jgi:hypothetical protein